MAAEVDAKGAGGADPAAAAAAAAEAYHPTKISMRTISAGDGTNYPTKGCTCRVHYVGRLKRDGTVFDSSRDRGMPIEFTLGMGQVIRGWDDALPTMSKDQIAEVTCPPAVAYGVRGYPPIIPPNATLIFEVELVNFDKP